MTARVIRCMAGAPPLTVAARPMKDMEGVTAEDTAVGMVAVMVAGTSAFRASTLILVVAGIEEDFH